MLETGTICFTGLYLRSLPTIPMPWQANFLLKCSFDESVMCFFLQINYIQYVSKLYSMTFQDISQFNTRYFINYPSSIHWDRYIPIVTLKFRPFRLESFTTEKAER